ncbi:hypothetical protein GRI89_06450 [Altererythrobacter salegens]|uniref:Uncharacterized protein n=1 Tax=Croceibacterium salegens TaxID=1737568 RepID=A0A6I4SUP4_9SPHN|nr:hypothetical protein [Croceibacterium salegens]MXO59178.1 hypothetical protein [Croceibacterium salegens]
MISFTALFSTFAFGASAFPPPPLLRADVAYDVRPGDAPPATGRRNLPAPFLMVEQAMRPQDQYQVRIEERVIIRIAPSPPATRERMLSTLPRKPMTTRFQEVKLDSCVPIQSIGGVAPVQPNRLLLFMRDRRVLSAALDRACDAQAFYSGFYVERSSDGMLCSGRDQLQSRAGTSCEVAQFNRLVAIKD